MIINGVCRILTLITHRTWKLLFMWSQFRMKQSMNDFLLTISNYVSHSHGGKNHENTSLQLLLLLWQKTSVKLYRSLLLRSQISSGSSGRMGGTRNMKSMLSPLAAIFFMTYFYRGGEGAYPSDPLDPLLQICCVIPLSLLLSSLCMSVFLSASLILFSINGQKISMLFIPKLSSILHCKIITITFTLFTEGKLIHFSVWAFFFRFGLFLFFHAS